MDLEEITSCLHGNDSNRYLPATINLRKLLLEENPEVIEAILDADIIPILIEFLDRKERVFLQYYAAWILNNITAGTSEQTEAVVDAGAVPYFVELLYSEDKTIAEQAAWALGNIARDGSEMRLFLIENNFIEASVDVLKEDIPIWLYRIVIWALSNACRDSDALMPRELLKECLEQFVEALSFSDTKIERDACWGIYNLSDGLEIGDHYILNIDVIPQLLSKLECSETSILSPALKSIGRLFSLDDAYSRALIDAGLHQILQRLLQNQSNSAVVKEVLCVMGIVITTEEIQSSMTEDILKSLINVLIYGNFESKKDAVWALHNFICGESFTQLQHGINLDILSPLFHMLTVNETITVQAIMQIIERIIDVMKFAPNFQIVLQHIEKFGGIDLLEEIHMKLQLEKPVPAELIHMVSKILRSLSGDPHDHYSLIPFETDDGMEYEFGVPLPTPEGGFLF